MRKTCLVFLLLCGCALTRPPSVKPLSARAPQTVLPRVVTLAWSPGGYSDFVVVTSADLAVPLNQWPTYAVTGQTYLQVAPSQPQQWFALYGTNADGDSGWATK